MELIKTESGSLYAIHREAKTWARLEHAPDNNFVRTRDGVFKECSPAIIGKPLLILAEPLTPLAPGQVGIRVIQTTNIVSIEQVADLPV